MLIIHYLSYSSFHWKNLITCHAHFLENVSFFLKMQALKSKAQAIKLCQNHQVSGTKLCNWPPSGKTATFPSSLFYFIFTKAVWNADMHGNCPYGHEISKPWTGLVQKLTRYARSGCSPTFKEYLKINYLKCIKDPEQVANRKSVFVRTSATGSLNYKPFVREEACSYVWSIDDDLAWGVSLLVTV